MHMVNIFSRLRRYGERQRQGEWLPKIAMELAEAAKAGTIDSDDAMDLYIIYYKAATGMKDPKPTDLGVKVNASKMRQIIKCKDPALLRRVTRVYDSMRKEGYKIPPLYSLMVEACRKSSTGDRSLSDDQIRKLARR